MCGFVGIFSDLEHNDSLRTQNKIEDMNNMIIHRGPDDSGYYSDQHVQLGFRRLSIIDLEAGHQPLSYENERYWIVFNGEIYNYLELRSQLESEGYHFNTHSDTEVLIALYSARNEKMVNELRGMFAFLIWDKQTKRLFGARDPFGIKPFYYTEQKDKTFFASERKSIALAVNEAEIKPESLQHYLTFQYVPEPSTMTQDIKKLQPGHSFIKISGQPMKIQRYWQPTFKPVQTDEAKMAKEIQDVLLDSVNIHMRSDVPVGSFLSGGIDSSFIVSLAKQINPKIKTFSVGFESQGYSEVDVAKETAAALDLENIDYTISPKEFIEELPKIIWHMDDPLADPAAVPLYFVAREAKKQVKVVLSGEGADELFGGYNIYRESIDLQGFDTIPDPIKKVLKNLVKIVPEGVKGKSLIERGCTPLEERYIGNAKIFEESEKRSILRKVNPHLRYRDVTSPFYKEAVNYDKALKMQHIDIHTWLRGDILLKADKMTMANSLELRVPFLDRKVFEVAAKIPTELKLANKTTKYILRKAAEGIVPEHILQRKKLGFPVPIRLWLKDEIYDWTVDLIKTSNVDHLINKEAVLSLLADHCANKKDNSRKLWTVIIFMLWYKIYIEKEYDFSSNLQEKETVLQK
ncbi:asparagine synthase (glutamine-hydrolyzing) [Domibacillus robiginosus]|uniref:asparagine synthase (glutamine-hydrolyzing) n=1 Tax=Domibacillus robiginosus TaxID=1071054 RepID=UPI00067B7BB4|nr:asparagine synthase (glutamine-hydrolyzing) [Domibacillus robiginosus]